MSFIIPEDIANRALQHLGVPYITLLSDSSKQAVVSKFCYDKLRRAELTKSVWGFAVRRAVLRKIISTTKPLVFGTYAAGTTYGIGDMVVDTNSVVWMSNKASNTGNTPGLGGLNPPWSVYYGPLLAQLWTSGIQFYPGDVAYTSTAAYIASAASLNQTQSANLTYWQPLTATLGAAVVFLSPVGYKPDATSVRNIYRMPANFLRMAPLDPKVAGNVRSNTSAGMPYNDYEFEAGYISSAAQTDPLVLRFVADQADVPTMDDLFCEALAARMAIEMAEPLTQSKDKLAMSTSLYDNVLTVAKMVNAVEAGTTEEDQTNPPIAAVPSQRAQ
jgi:hypothetical protein